MSTERNCQTGAAHNYRWTLFPEFGIMQFSISNQMTWILFRRMGKRHGYHSSILPMTNVWLQQVWESPSSGSVLACHIPTYWLVVTILIPNLFKILNPNRYSKFVWNCILRGTSNQQGVRCLARTKFVLGTENLTLRRLMLYIYGAPILDVSRSHTTTQHSR